jgi:hypothetical protein
VASDANREDAKYTKWDRRGPSALESTTLYVARPERAWTSAVPFAFFASDVKVRVQTTGITFMTRGSAAGRWRTSRFVF